MDSKELKAKAAKIRMSKISIQMRLSNISKVGRYKALAAYRRLQNEFISYVATYGDQDTFLTDKAKLIADAAPQYPKS